MNGHLDGMTGGYIVGWAEDGPATCEITVRYGDGALVATGSASWTRPDLASLKLGRTNLAFRIAVGKISHQVELHAFANGIELPNSPVMVGPGFYDGKITIVGGAFEGWVTERSLGFTPPFITIKDQHGRIVGRTQSVITDPEADPNFTPADFFAELDQVCFGCGELNLTAYADGVRFATAQCHLLLEGNLEITETDHCSGWLFSPCAPHRNFNIEVFRNDEAPVIARCRNPRTDVSERFPDSRNPGFTVKFPSSVARPLDVTTMSLRLPASDLELFGGPYVLAGRPALIDASRRVAQLAADLGNGLDPIGRAVLQAAMTSFLARSRDADQQLLRHHIIPPAPSDIRLSVIIPVYRGVEITRACIESVLVTRQTGRDRIVVIDDCSPEPDMAAMLQAFADRTDFHILTNLSNIGFVQSVNRGLGFCGGGDVVLLNSDTEMFPGGLDQLWSVAHGSPNIGTVTALSNNATIFSYPHFMLRTHALVDMTWAELAATALDLNAGQFVDVPTGHGFCMLIRAEALHRVGDFDELFGRGYGEENDFCNRAADLGYRNVAAAGVLVLHHESVSFKAEKLDLIAQNLQRLETRYPEYNQIIIEVERRDDLRSCRWKLDAARLKRASLGGARFALVVKHSIGGGTARAIADIEASVGYGDLATLNLACRPDGVLELRASHPSLYALFAPGETDELVRVLAAAEIDLVVVHQLLGYTVAFADALQVFIEGRRSVFYAHDFYSLCPRVTMINAVGQFCRLASVTVCTRCIAAGGPHAGSRFKHQETSKHRALFENLLARFTHVVTPSEDAARYLQRGFPGLVVEAISHPTADGMAPLATRRNAAPQITVFGALGPHKGSAKLLEIARLAKLESPDIQFRIVGFTDIDDALQDVGNVEITGAYKPTDLPRLVANCTGRFALFLSEWPETFSYTLSEALHFGFIPIVPDLGAPAERVRNSGFGEIYPFPNSAEIILAKVMSLLKGEYQAYPAFDATASHAMAIARTRVILHGAGPQDGLADPMQDPPTDLPVIQPVLTKAKPLGKQKRRV